MPADVTRCSLPRTYIYIQLLNVVYTRLSDPSIDQQMRYLVKLDALHPKMSHFSSFCDLRSDLSSLDFVVNKFFMKLFTTGNINIVRECQLMFNFELPIATSWKKEASSLMTMISLFQTVH